MSIIIVMDASPPSQRSYRGASAADRQSARRAQMIAAAIRLYGQHGYRRTSVRAVCQEAQLTERYFYESFANSEALLAAAYETVLARLLEGLAEADGLMPEQDREGRARASLHRYYAALRDQPAAARVFLIEITGVNDTIDRLFEESMFRLTAPLIALLDPEGGSPAACDPLVQRGMAGGLLHIALAWIDSGYARPVEEVSAVAFTLCAPLATPR
jgi:AcrR family transcriptional regulator